MAFKKVIINVHDKDIFRLSESVDVNPNNPSKDLIEDVVTNVFVIGTDRNGLKVRVDIIDSVDLESIE